MSHDNITMPIEYPDTATGEKPGDVLVQGLFVSE